MKNLSVDILTTVDQRKFVVSRGGQLFGGGRSAEDWTTATRVDCVSIVIHWAEPCVFAKVVLPGNVIAYFPWHRIHSYAKRLQENKVEGD